MSLRLVPNSVTLDDLERRHSPNRSIISPKSVAATKQSLSMLQPRNALTRRANLLVLIVLLASS